MRFKYGLKAQKLLAQDVWGKTYECSIKKRGTRPLQQKVKSGEEWVKSARTLFTPRNADKHRGFGAFGEE